MARGDRLPKMLQTLVAVGHAGAIEGGRFTACHDAWMVMPFTKDATITMRVIAVLMIGDEHDRRSDLRSADAGTAHHRLRACSGGRRRIQTARTLRHPSPRIGIWHEARVVQ